MKKRLLDTATVLLDKFVNRYHDCEGFWQSVFCIHIVFH